LVEVAIEDSSRPIYLMPMSAVYRFDAPPGPAGRWLIEHLRERHSP
jgi:hypothetical protein